MTVNRPDVIAELSLQHDAYEKAVLANDVVAINALWWDSHRAPPAGMSRNSQRLKRRFEITTFGESAGLIHFEIAPTSDSESSVGETEFWIRFDDGWKIVSAHISSLTDRPSYIDVASSEIRLPIDPEMRVGVIADFNRISAAADFLMQFRLEQDVEPAPVFHPEP